MDDSTLERLLGVFDRRSWEINRQFLIKAAKHLKEIGELPPSDVHRITEMRRMNTSLREIRNTLAGAMEADIADVDAILAQVAKDNDWAARTMLRNGGEALPIMENAPLLRMLEAASRATHEALTNLSNTTLDDTAYRHGIDRAIHAVNTGVADYGSEIQRCVREMAREGLKVQYPSGISRRLDTAVRQNVLDGARYVNRESMRILGEEYGADGVEIDAHMLCADDHLPYQGRQYTLDEFQKIQDSLERPFGQWNCRHMIHYIVLGASPRGYSDEELAEMRKNSTEEIEIDGVTKTRYEWSQAMRRLETQARYQNDETEALKAIGDRAGARISDHKASEIVDAYDRVCQAAGLPPEYNRMYVGRGTGESRLARNNKLQMEISASDEYEGKSLFWHLTGTESVDILYSAALGNRYNEGTELAKKVYDRYIPQGGKVIDGNYVPKDPDDPKAFYDPSRIGIFMNYRDDALDPRGAGVVWFHEHGHYLDDLKGSWSQNKEFYAALKTDYKNLLNRSEEKLRSGKINELREWLYGKDEFIYSSVSDLLCGFSKGQVAGGFRHKKSYYNKRSIPSEAFAHMFEAQFSELRAKAIKETFPTAYELFLNYLGGLI